MTAEILNVTPEQYFALPGLSSSIAKVIVEKSPLHAKVARDSEREATKNMDRGAVIHRLVLGKGKSFTAVDADDWRTNKAKDARDAARAQGLVPVLAKHLDEHRVAAEKIREELARRGFHLDGDSEVAVQWHEGETLCRSMFDHVWLKRGSVGTILDLKITDDASPDFVERNSERLGYAIQAAAYTRALTALRPELAGRVDFLFAFCEPETPWAMNISRPDGAFRAIGEARWLRAVQMWERCLRTNEWPAYGDGVNALTVPRWVLSKEGFAA